MSEGEIEANLESARESLAHPHQPGFQQKIGPEEKKVPEGMFRPAKETSAPE
jgi:hypothetical protein